MDKMKVDEAREALRQAEIDYGEVEARHQSTLNKTSTAEVVLDRIETRSELEAMAQRLLAARDRVIEIDREVTELRVATAKEQLADVEAELVVAVRDAEAAVAGLEPVLKRVIDLSRKRYAYKKDAGMTAPMSLLARGATTGWLQWRLRELELPDLEHPPHHFRAPLADLLGLTHITPHDHEEVDNDAEK